MRIHAVWQQEERNRAALEVVAEQNTTVSSALQGFFFPQIHAMSLWRMVGRCNVLLRLCQALSHSFILPPTSETNSFSLEPLQSLQQHDFTACTNYNLAAPSSIAFPLFCQNDFPLFVFCRLSGSLHITKGIPYPFIAVTFHHILLFQNLAALLSFGIHLAAPVMLPSNLVPPFAAAASVFWHYSKSLFCRLSLTIAPALGS